VTAQQNHIVTSVCALLLNLISSEQKEEKSHSVVVSSLKC